MATKINRRSYSTEKEKCDLAGVKFSWILDEFIPSCGGEQALKSLTTDDVLQKFTKAQTEALQISYCDLLKHQGRHDAVQAKADVFISHWFGYEFLDVVDAIRCNLLKTGGSLDSYVWWDLFSINQHGPANWSFEWLSTTFKGSIGEIGEVVMVMTPWNEPRPFTRGWCVFEAYSAIVTNSKFEIALSRREERLFIKDVTQQGTKAIDTMLAEVRAENSQCAVQAERERIFQVIRNEVGFSKLNGLLFEKYRSWVIETAISALKSCKDELGECAICNLVGALHVRQGNYAMAKPYVVNAFEKYKTLLGDNHGRTLTSMSNLASLSRNLGDYDGAKQLYVDCLDRQMQNLGDAHPATLWTMNDLGLLYMSLGDYDNARAFFDGCLHKRKQVLGDEHPQTLQSINNLACLYRSQGEYNWAESLYVDCLDKRRKILGAEHPDTLIVVNNLAGLFEEQGKYGAAEPLYVDCFNISKKVFGAENPSTLTAMNNLAGLFGAQGNYREAEPLYVDCLDKSKKLFGDRHPITLSTANNLANLYHSQDEHKKGRASFGRLP